MLNFRVVEEWWLCHGAKFASFYFLHLLELVFFDHFHFCCVFWCLVIGVSAIFVLCAVVDPSSRQPNSPTTNFCTLRFYFAHLIGSPVTLTAQRLWHILTLYRSLPSPLCLFTSPSLSALALCLSAVVSLCSGPIRRPAVDPESLESGRFSLSDDVLVVHSLSSISVGILKPTGQFKGIFTQKMFFFFSETQNEMDVWDVLFYTTKVDHFHNSKLQKKKKKNTV